MKHITSITSLTLIAASGFAQSASTSDFTQSANISIASDYVYRGVSQTNSSLAVQGGFDVAHSCGLSAGVWASNVALGNSSEVDLYASYSLAITKDVSAALGYKHYVYDGVSALNTGEINASVSAYGLTGTINWALTDYFGAPNSDGKSLYGSALAGSATTFAVSRKF